MPLTLQSLIAQDTTALSQRLSLTPVEARIEIQMLLQRTLSVARAYLLAHSERELSDKENNDYQALLQRRMAGEPIAYILGSREFFGLDLHVTPATLIPRPDTELLVELALERIAVPNARVLDMGTGSGAIALALAHQRPALEVWACDISVFALEVARANARKLKLANMHCVESDWFSAFAEQQFDLIVSNPPYIAADDIHLSQGDVRFEPLSALVSGDDGLDDIRHIVAEAGRHLHAHGWLLLEHGYDQAARVREILAQSGFTTVFSAADLAGIERCSGGQWPA